METNYPYRYERMSPENIHHLNTLFKIIFKKNIPVEEIEKKYNTDYLGKSYLGHIAFDGLRPVAFGGFVPFKIQYKNIVEIGAQSVDSMSLPELSGKGVFAKIAWMNEDIMKADGIHFAYGFGNQNSVPVFVHKFNYVTNECMSVFLIRVSQLPLMRTLKKVGLREQYKKRVEGVLGPLMTTEIFPNPLQGGDHGYTVYDEDFFKYRSYKKHDMIRLNGIKVWLKADHVLSVGNIEQCSGEQLLGTVETLCELARQMGFDKIFMQYSERAEQVSILKEKYTPIQGSPICFKSFTSKIPLDKVLFANGDVDTF
jgi:hypothetical protein